MLQIETWRVWNEYLQTARSPAEQSANYTEAEPSEEDDENDGLFVPSARTEHWLFQRRLVCLSLLLALSTDCSNDVRRWAISPPMEQSRPSWAGMLSPNPHPLLFVGLFGFLEMKWCLTSANQELSCRYFLGERSGSGSGRRYSALRKTRRCCGKFANYLKGQLSKSSLPLDGYRQVV